MNPTIAAVPQVCKEVGCQRTMADNHWHPQPFIEPMSTVRNRAQNKATSPLTDEEHFDSIKKVLFSDKEN